MVRQNTPQNFNPDINSFQVVHHETPVLIVGAGPSGLIAALQLSAHGVRSMLVERNLDTTKWPKMDITNCRSMELFKRLNVDQGLREVGPSHHSVTLPSPLLFGRAAISTTAGLLTMLA